MSPTSYSMALVVPAKPKVVAMAAIRVMDRFICVALLQVQGSPPGFGAHCPTFE